MHVCPSGSSIFAPRPLLNWLQFAGDYTLYDPESFNRDSIQRYAHTSSKLPNPLQPQRAAEAFQNFGSYSERELMNEQRKEVLQTIEGGHRVFVIFPQDLRERYTQFLAGHFSIREAGRWYDPATLNLVDRQRWMGSPQVRWKQSDDLSRTWDIIEITPFKR
jgi:hypothetical protein